MALFQRQVIVQFGQPGEVGKSFSDLKVSFQVVMSRASDPNQAKISIWNLSRDSVKALQADGAVVRLLAGYTVPRQIFEGNPIASGVKVRQQGQDRVVEIEAQDGGKTYQEARVSISIATPTSLQEVLDEALSQVGAFGAASGAVRSDLSEIKLTQGFSFEGPARELLDRLALSSGSYWTLRDGAIQFVEDGESTGEVAIEFSAETGNLIGSPSEKDSGVEVTALIAPSLRPGKHFSVASENVNGLYLADDVAFRGDSQSGEFYVVASGTPVG